MAHDRGYALTARAVERQLRAMGAEAYEVGLRDQVTDKMLPRTYTLDQALTAVGWLRERNGAGDNILVRPATDPERPHNVGLVLVDDLTLERARQLYRDGLTPAAVTETSRDNYQAWVRLTRDPLAPEVATAAARELAGRYGGDPASADWRHYGRLAGFTNRKPTRTRADGHQPYVLLHEDRGREAPRAGEILEAAARRVERERADEAARRVEIARAGGVQDRERAGDNPFSRPEGGALIGGRAPGLAEEYRRRADQLLTLYPGADISRLDYTVLRELARRHPDATARDLTAALHGGSPRIHERKTNERHLEAYTTKTVTRVLLDPEVRQVRAEHDRVHHGRHR